MDELCEAYLDLQGVIYKPHFGYIPVDDAVSKTEAALTNVTNAGHFDNEFLIGSKQTIADLVWGCIWVNYVNNPACFAPERWAEVRAKFPKFCAWGEKFAKRHSAYLAKRPVAPI